MSDFINTVDTVGDVALADSIITRSITEFRDNVVTKLGRGAFYQCDSLTTVDLPAVTRVGYEVFGNCDALVDVSLPLATEIGGNAFDSCSALTRIVFPSVTTIGSKALRACDVLSTVELGSKTSIGEYAFYISPALKVLALRSTAGVSTLSYTNAFNGTPIESGTGYIYVPGTLLNSYKTATNWSTYANQFRKLEDWTVDGTVAGELDIENRHMVRFFNDDGTLLGYKIVATGSDAVYDGTPVCSEDASWPFEGFAPSPTNVTADMDCYAQYEEPFSLETASWAEISAISAAGTGANYFSVGETKSIEIKGTMGIIELDTTLYVYILGFNHNSAVEGNGIHFGGFKTNSGEVGIDVALVSYVTSTKSDDGTKCFNLNHWGNSIYGGWAACDLRYDILGSTDVAPNNYGSKRTSASVGYDATDTCATNPVDGTLMSCLPEELRAVMKPITKWSSNVGTDNKQESCIVPSVDYLPLLAEFEVLGQNKYANVYEQNYQQQYAYYASGNSIIKYLHTDASTTTSYWTRSPQSGSNAVSVVISTRQINGIFAGTSGSFWTYGIAPVFMV